MFSLKWAEEKIPGFLALADCPQDPRYHLEGDVLIHVKYVYVNVRTHIAQAGIDGNPLAQEDAEILIAAALIHDLKKPQATEEDETTGKVTARGHAELAADATPSLAREIFGLTDQAMIDKLQWVVAHHMHAHQLPQFGEKKRLEYYQHPAWPLLEAFEHCDAMGGQRENGEWGPSNLEFFRQDRPTLLAKAEKEAAGKLLQSRIAAALLAILPASDKKKIGPLKQAVTQRLEEGSQPTDADIARLAQEEYDKTLGKYRVTVTVCDGSPDSVETTIRLPQEMGKEANNQIFVCKMPFGKLSEILKEYILDDLISMYNKEKENPGGRNEYYCEAKKAGQQEYNLPKDTDPQAALKKVEELILDGWSVSCGYYTGF